jgi:hypothetical protein
MVGCPEVIDVFLIFWVEHCSRSDGGPPRHFDRITPKLRFGTRETQAGRPCGRKDSSGFQDRPTTRAPIREEFAEPANQFGREVCVKKKLQRDVRSRPDCEA